MKKKGHASAPARHAASGAKKAGRKPAHRAAKAPQHAKYAAKQKPQHPAKYTAPSVSNPLSNANLRRVATGLHGLDQMLQGGLPSESVVLLSGACGTGKSTFAMQFLYYGAKYCNEPGVYVTLEEDPKKFVENMSLFGWDLQKLIDQKKLIVVKPEVYKFDSIKQIIGDAIERIGAKRLVVDSYSVLLTYFNDPYEIRNGLVQLDREIKKMGCTAMVISDIKDNSEIFSTTGVEEFIVDGVIVLYLIKSVAHPYESRRAIAVRKMRATSHPLNFYPFDIGTKGISVAGEGLTGGRGGEGRGAGGGSQQGAPEKKSAAPQKPNSMVEVNALKAKGGHTWRWKHL